MQTVEPRSNARSAAATHRSASIVIGGREAHVVLGPGDGVELGAHRPGAERHHPHPGAAHLLRDRLGEVEDERLGCGVGRHVGDRLERGRAREVDDPAGSRLDQPGQDRGRSAAGPSATFTSTSARSRAVSRFASAPRVANPALLTRIHGDRFLRSDVTARLPACVARSAASTSTVTACFARISVAQRFEAIDPAGDDGDVVTARRQASCELGADTRRGARDEGRDRGWQALAMGLTS